MSRIRSFSSQYGEPSAQRNVEDAPAPMRPELIDSIYQVADDTRRQALKYGGQLDVDEDLYLIIEQSLGYDAAGNPAAGRRQRIGRDLANADWRRVYDLIERLWPEFQSVGADDAYRDAVNRVLAAHGVAWELGPTGQLRRVTPVTAQKQLFAAFTELSEPRFAAGLQLYKNATEAYDERPQRGRDACANMFDALESVSKEVFGMAHATFYDVLCEARRRDAFRPEVINTLERVNTLRNRHFGHGMTQRFQLSAAEVDFAYLTCVAGILLFVRSANANPISPIP